MPTWARLVVAIAAVRIAAALALYFSGHAPASAGAQVPAAVYAVLLISFTALGLALIVTNRNDVRASWLGAVLILIVVPLSNVFVRSVSASPWSYLDAIRPDAFLAAATWRFVIEFPRPLESGKRPAAMGLAHVSTAAGVWLMAVNLSLLLVPASRTAPGWRALFLTWNNVGSIYWPLLFLLAGAGLLTLIARLFASAGDDRARARIFVSGLAAGLMPLLVEVLIEELVAPYKAWVHSPAIEPIAGAILFSAFGAVPFITAYSVVYDRVVDTRLLVRAAIQYALARYTIIVVTAIPLAALTFYLIDHRAEPLANLLSGTRAIVLITALAAGLAALRGRAAILRAIDRRFFRDVHDTQLLVAALVGDDALARPPAEIAQRLRDEIDRTLHARADLFVIDDDGVMLRDPTGERAPLSAMSTFVTLALADARPMDIDTGHSQILARLPAAERAWLESGGYELAMALKLRSGGPAGLLALTAKRSELQYSPSELHAIHALAVPLALAIDNDRLSRAPSTEPQARECTTCSRLLAHDAAQCSCGGALVDATAPHTLRGTFRFEQRIGAGGMGVVYRATDLSLGREVAIKTLPRVTPDHVAQLKREAQAMASVQHAHLAVIYGIESWRGTPFLVEEYLAGGMLSHRLKRAPLAIGETLELGVSLAQVLEQLHASGMVHCDVKPSNIGFASTGVVKLVDFGLAYLLRESAHALATTTAMTTGASSSPEHDMIVTARGVMGTPAYMSPEATVAATPAPGFDLWGLTVVLFECLTGQRPFVGKTTDEVFFAINAAPRPDVRSFRADCPDAVESFFRDGLAIDQSQRPLTAQALSERLLALRSAVA